jgi:cytochrome c-type biogenesis protein CcsB
MKKIFDKLFSTTAAGMYMAAFAISIAVATFVENDFGTSSAQNVIFRAWWFELLLVLFGVTIVVNIFRFRMVQQKKWAALMFHTSIIIILLGAGVTRYFSYEGMMHIREGSSSNHFMLSDAYLQFEANYKGSTYRFDEKVYFATLGNNHFKKSYQIEDKVVDVELKSFLPNPTKVLESSESGVPILKVVVAGPQGREEYFLKDKDYLKFNGMWFNFGNPEQARAVNIYYRNDSLLFSAPWAMTQMVMATQTQDSIQAHEMHILRTRALYSNDQLNFVVSDFMPSGQVFMKSESRKMRNNSIASLDIGVTVDGETASAFVFGNKGMEGRQVPISVGDVNLRVSYGTKLMELPFSLQLNDFIMERYPGTNSASSYASEVTLIDTKNDVRFDQRIYMNYILDYDGYRFFQSSFDQDELGTVLSVNHDFWGTWISYIGYIFLTLGLVLTFFSKNSRFQSLSRNLKRMRESTGKALAGTAMILALITLSPSVAFGKTIDPEVHPAIPKEHAAAFGRLLVQDHKGRLKPINTMASEVLRKLSRKESAYGLTADQVFVGMMVNSDDWYGVPMIKMGRHEDLRKIIQVQGKLASYDDFFDESGHYKLQEQVRRAYSLEPIDRGVFDKEIMKIDERVNICNLVFGARLIRIYPMPEDPNNLWLSPGDMTHQQDNVDANEFVRKWYLAYVQTVNESLESGDWDLADELVTALHEYQQKFGKDLVISDEKVKLEIALNKIHLFSRLGKIYGLLGLLFLGAFFTSVFNHRFNLKWPLKTAFGIMALCFAMQTAGLGIRWYISGHAPWSNGYESMIYIAWTTILAGLIFARKSIGGLAATSILASTILMVAGLSWLDPEITPLVPVLKSYWLTIHVSLEAGSYGFLALGAIIGVLNLVSMIFTTDKNKARVSRTIKEMTTISEMTLLGGLVMVSIGTYLGGVWANESWGRYWGWDAKETWALVTILVYAFILHMRFIPGLRGAYAFNVASLFGFASVMMTYFGVNYYLSGLHSYAAGDPVPIPTFVYYTVGSLAAISLLALWRNRRLS